MRLYRTISLLFAVAFAAVGLFFLVLPELLFEWLDRLALAIGDVGGMPAGDAEPGLFRVLGAAYMYLVALFAWMMFRRPDEPIWPTLLAHAKLASAALSVLLFLVLGPYLILPLNGVVDGFIGLVALLLRRQSIRRRDAIRRKEAGDEHPAVPA